MESLLPLQNQTQLLRQRWNVCPHSQNTSHSNVRSLLSNRHRALRVLAGISLAGIISFISPPANAQTLPSGTQHSATVTWSSPSPIGGSGTIAGYNVYKSLAGAAFAKINTTLIAGLTTIDTAVSAGQSVAYCVTTVDSKAEESACSASVGAVIPTNPNPPSVSVIVN